MKTLLRWAGGKKRFISWMEETVDFEIDEANRIIEPFAGSAAFFFHYEKPGVINDANYDLINFYKWVRDDYIRLMSDIKSLFREDYYNVREAYNRAIGLSWRDSRMNAARFYYLNRKGFNGIYRVNSSGRYNVPLGKVTNFLNTKEEFEKVSNLLATSTISCGDYKDIALAAVPGDVVYFDPPYYQHESSGFNSYTNNRFNEDDNVRLLSVASSLKERGIKILISNSAAPDLISALKDFPDLSHKVIQTNRNINPRVEDRTKFKEILIF